jgi:hypothetical protein
MKEFITRRGPIITAFICLLTAATEMLAGNSGASTGYLIAFAGWVWVDIERNRLTDR